MYFKLHAVVGAVAEQLFDLVGLIGERKRDVGDAGATQRVDLIKQKRPIANWHDRLRGVDSQRAAAACLFRRQELVLACLIT